MNVTKRIKLDFARSLNPVVVWVKQGDENSRFIEIVPLKNGESYTIPSGVSIKFACKKPDGHQVLNDYPTISNNIITVPLSPQTLAAAGEGLASIILFDDANQKILSTQNFILYIEQNPLVGSEVESSDEYQSFLAGLLKLESFPEITPEAEGKVLGVKDGEYAFVNGGNGSTEITGKNYVTAYGAKGDGVTDDTAAFKSAMESERVVFVPGGTYKLSEGITIGDNCCLELSQDTVLDFTNTEGNCITLGMISHLKGNYATVKVPYEFSGNVVYAYSNDHTNAEQNQVPPFTRWDPQWKSGRYVTDINICKADHRGFHYLVNAGECKGTAVYMSSDRTAGLLTYMWGIHYSGLRIAGAFAYGIRAVNFDDGWMHEMRIDAFIDACEIGVCLEDCNNTYVSAIIQPRRGYTDNGVYFPYAKNGIKLVRSKNTDLSGSRVWDWSVPDDPTTTVNEKITLYEVGNEYQHIAMIGNCSGTIINDYTYNDYGDTRERIYTDETSNLDTLIILQEPIDKIFKMRDGTPYCFDGLTEKRLIAQDEMKEYFNTELVKQFTDVLPTAIDTDGSIYGEKGYKSGYIYSNGTIGTTSYEYCYVTGFFPCQKGSKIYVQGMSFEHGDNNCKIALYDSNFNHIGNAQRQQLLNNGGNDYIGYQAMEGGYVATVKNDSKNDNVAYARISVYKADLGKNPMISIDKEIKSEFVGFLADGIKVKGENVIGNVGEVQPDWVATHTYTEGESVYDERNLFFENHNTAYLKDYGGSFKINIGIEYDVYWGGKRYTCEAKSYDDTPYLGNGSLGLYGAENTGEPFCLYGSFTSADTIAYVKKDNSETATISLKVTFKGEAEYSKMPVEYLPDEVALKSDIPEGDSIDVTAEVGQTIVVKEVDENGKPTKWKASEIGFVNLANDFNTNMYLLGVYEKSGYRQPMAYDGAYMDNKGTLYSRGEQVLTASMLPKNEPIIADTSEYTPAEFAELAMSGETVFLMHQDANIGVYVFSSYAFDYMANKMICNTTTTLNGSTVLIQLFGDAVAGTWQMTATPLATAE